MPSLFLSYNLIRASYFNDRVRTFVADELSFPNTQIIEQDGDRYQRQERGESSPDRRDRAGDDDCERPCQDAEIRLEKRGLVVQQGFGQEATDINELKSLLMQDLYKNSEEVLRAQSSRSIR